MEIYTDAVMLVHVSTIFYTIQYTYNSTSGTISFPHSSVLGQLAYCVDFSHPPAAFGHSFFYVHLVLQMALIAKAFFGLLSDKSKPFGIVSASQQESLVQVANLRIHVEVAHSLILEGDNVK